MYRHSKLDRMGSTVRVVLSTRVKLLSDKQRKPIESLFTHLAQ